MSRIFLSHSSSDNFAAIALRDWLRAAGWDDVFLDLDPERGIVAGERWERKLHEASSRCEVVIFLVSAHWLGSDWCLKEYNLAHGLNKKLFAVLIDPSKTINELPATLTGTWQVVDLVHRQDMEIFRVADPDSHAEKHITFSREGLRRLKSGLERAGLDPKFFPWPPPNEPDRAPYRGLRALEAADAGIFFGRDAPIIEFSDALRGLRAGAPPRLLVILGASGAGKSSFLRAGLLPRLMRDDANFLPLPPIRPGRAALTGENGLLAALVGAFPDRPRADLRAAIKAGAAGVRPLLGELVDKAFRQTLADAESTKPPTIVIAIDQAEELFRAEGAEEGATLLCLMRDLTATDDPAVIVIFVIRSDSYDALQSAKALEGLPQKPLSLLPMPRNAYREVIERPAQRVVDAGRNLAIEPQLINHLLEDIEQGGGKDALPLLAFTLEQLYLEYGSSGSLRLQDYQGFGGFKGAIAAAVERAFSCADADPRIPRDRAARETLLRRGLIPWLAGVDPESKSPRRNIARRSDIPAETIPLIDLLVEERLLSTDTVSAKDATGKEVYLATIEPAHEALLRQWGLLEGWLAEDFGLLATLEGVKRATRDWDANGQVEAWLAHQGQRLIEAQALNDRPDIAAKLEPTDHAYLTACRKKEAAARSRQRRVQAFIYTLLVGIIAGLLGWINQDYLKDRVTWVMTTRPYMYRSVRPYVLGHEAERELKPGDTFTECDKDCPLMVVIPAGDFMMGSPVDEPGRASNEGPRHEVKIGRRFAVSSDEAVFAEWDLCVKFGNCRPISDGGWGRRNQPVINITWVDAKQYAAWLSRMTGRDYRLLTEAEYEYATRAHTTSAYYWGPDLGKGNASCNGCKTKYDGVQPSPAGSFPANGFGLHDMLGNVWEWVEDCYKASYEGAPTDGRAWIFENCPYRVARGGTWTGLTKSVLPRSALRDWRTPDAPCCGFRVARTLAP